MFRKCAYLYSFATAVHVNTPCIIGLAIDLYSTDTAAELGYWAAATGRDPSLKLQGGEQTPKARNSAFNAFKNKTNI